MTVDAAENLLPSHGLSPHASDRRPDFPKDHFWDGSFYPLFASVGPFVATTTNILITPAMLETSECGFFGETIRRWQRIERLAR
jgi:hypothetical protein